MSDPAPRVIAEQEIGYARQEWINRTMDVHRLHMKFGSRRTVEQEIQLAKACVARDDAGTHFETVGALWEAQRKERKEREEVNRA